MTFQERCQLIQQFAQSSVPDVIPRWVEAVRDPVTCYTALCSLKQIGTPEALEALSGVLLSGQHDESQAARVINWLNTKYFAYPVAYVEKQTGEIPLCVFFVLADAQTDADYAAFVAWQQAHDEPLITIVTIDDEPDNAELFRMVFLLIGNACLIGKAPNAELGLRVVERLQPMVVFVDLMMPGMDGLTAGPLIRTLVPHSSLILRSYRLVETAEGFDKIISYGPLFIVELEGIVGEAGALYRQRKRGQSNRLAVRE